MEKKADEHICTIRRPTQTFIEPLTYDANIFRKWQRQIKRITLISERNPRCFEFYRTSVEIANQRRVQVRANSIIIHPFSMFSVYHEMVMVLIYLLCLIYIPIDAAFDKHPNSYEHKTFKSFKIICLLVNILCILDICIRFLTGYEVPSEKEVIMNPWKIAKHYVTSIHFYADVSCSIIEPSFYTTDWRTLRAFDIIPLLKITRIVTLFVYMSRSCTFLNIKNSTRVRAVRLFILWFMVSHWATCIIYLVPRFRQFSEYKIDQHSWLTRWNLLAHPISIKYAASFYKAIGYMFCINIDVEPMECWEEVFTACILYCAGRLFIFFLSMSVLRMFLGQRALETKYHEIMCQLDSFMLMRNLPTSLREKLVQNYEYLYSNTYFKENKITGLLSEALRKDINGEVLRKLVEDVPLFQDVPQYNLSVILSYLKSEIFLPNDIIIKAGSQGDCIYFLASGTVSVTTPSGKEVCHLHDGAYFGEVCLVTNQKKRSVSVLALETCKVYKMGRKGFLTCFKGNSELWNKLSQRAMERIELTQIYEDIYVRGMHEKTVGSKRTSV